MRSERCYARVRHPDAHGMGINNYKEKTQRFRNGSVDSMGFGMGAEGGDDSFCSALGLSSHTCVSTHVCIHIAHAHPHAWGRPSCVRIVGKLGEISDGTAALGPCWRAPQGSSPWRPQSVTSGVHSLHSGLRVRVSSWAGWACVTLANSRG